MPVTVESVSGGSNDIRVLVVDDHGIVRDGLTAILERSPRMTVVGTASSGKQAISAARRLAPDVIVMDLIMPELNGVDALERVLHDSPRTRVVIFSVCDTAEHIVRALRAGAQGYVVKKAATSDIVEAVFAVHEGRRFLSTGVQAALDGIRWDAADLSPLERLSQREREVLHLTASGATTGGIARRLSLSPKTVETYRSRIMRKLGVADRTALIHFAIEHALTPL